mmetsp:Transcript_7688/g.16039  ORF Transcript_7688/g.16039 Transcript_7688/m.16039 type:complete len:92 (+) Transcript_7688:191-466(+)
MKLERSRRHSDKAFIRRAAVVLGGDGRHDSYEGSITPSAYRCEKGNEIMVRVSFGSAQPLRAYRSCCTKVATSYRLLHRQRQSAWFPQGSW